MHINWCGLLCFFANALAGAAQVSACNTTGITAELPLSANNRRKRGGYGRTHDGCTQLLTTWMYAHKCSRTLISVVWLCMRVVAVITAARSIIVQTILRTNLLPPAMNWFFLTAWPKLTYPGLYSALCLLYGGECCNNDKTFSMLPVSQRNWSSDMMSRTEHWRPPHGEACTLHSAASLM